MDRDGVRLDQYYPNFIFDSKINLTIRFFINKISKSTRNFDVESDYEFNEMAGFDQNFFKQAVKINPESILEASNDETVQIAITLEAQEKTENSSVLVTNCFVRKDKITETRYNFVLKVESQHLQISGNWYTLNEVYSCVDDHTKLQSNKQQMHHLCHE